MIPAGRRSLEIALLLAGAATIAASCGKADGDANAQARSAEFRARDGVLLKGRVFGSGSVAVVLSHMGRPGDNQRDWIPVAEALAEQSYTALTYNRRGVCSAGSQTCSKGVDDYSESWKDVAGAVGYLRAHGATKVVLVGASIGAMSSLHVATRDDVKVDGLVEVGGINNASGYSFTREQVARISVPKLFVSSAEDIYGGAGAARQWHRWATQPKRLEILPGGDHGTDLLREPASRDRLTALIVGFVDGVADAM